MNDFDYDVKEKKRIAAGARARKCGSKSKRCTLPSDYLTAKQKKGLNGKMKTFNLSAPMNYGEFKNMPKDLQKEYLTKLYLEWGVGTVEIGKMFGCSSETVRKACRNLGINTSRCGHKMSYEQLDFWHSWLRQGREASEEAAESVVKELDSETKAETDSEPVREHSISNGALVQNIIFTAAGSLEELYECFANMMCKFGSEGQYQIRVECYKAVECGNYGKA